ATMEGMWLATGNPVYRRLFEFWIKIFAVSFGMGVVTGIVMAFQFGTNWSVLAEKTGSIQGPLLGYETFTAFLLEGTFLGVMLIGRDRVSPPVYFFACCMVSLWTLFSSFSIMANNSWMQVPVGHQVVDGKVVPSDWGAIIAGPVFLVRWPHMLLAAFLTTSMCVIATGAWYLLRGIHRSEARGMMQWGKGLAAVLIPVQLLIGHLNGAHRNHDKDRRYPPDRSRTAASRGPDLVDKIWLPGGTTTPRSRSLARCRARSCTTIPSWRWRASVPCTAAIARPVKGAPGWWT
ncbi:MAG: cytochrome ubiquinol oxidase subunit I, partial [Acetobacteraceae bacterium]|nr:cytochrome ubiquinol oxidase subunit I [Acetobacteraceae bacterium]